MAGYPSLSERLYLWSGRVRRVFAASRQSHPSDMTLVGFSLLSVFYPEPRIRPATDMDLIHEWGITRHTLQQTLERISCPIAVARAQAADLRAMEIATAYKPSILRRHPCLLVGHRARTMIAPLPDLIMDRVTNGLFYDVVGGGGAVRDEVGRKFESYALDLLKQMLPAVLFHPESSYRTPLGPIATPDILMHDRDGAVSLAIECKASRMSVAARFGEAPGEDRGYEEIAKGVMQLWRFYAHSRLGIAPRRLSDDVKLMILTLDEWFAGRATIIPQILERAHVLADASAHAISREDRLPSHSALSLSSRACCEPRLRSRCWKRSRSRRGPGRLDLLQPPSRRGVAEDRAQRLSVSGCAGRPASMVWPATRSR